MDILPLLYYLKYFILHVGYKSLQSGFLYIYIFRERENFFWCIKNIEDCLLQATRNIAIVCVWRKISLHEPVGNTCFLGALPNSCFEGIFFGAKRTFPFSHCLWAHCHWVSFLTVIELSCPVQGDVAAVLEQCRWGDPSQARLYLFS